MMRYVIVPSALLILLILISASTNYGASARTEMVKVMTESNQIGNPIWTLGKPDDSDLEFGKAQLRFVIPYLRANSSRRLGARCRKVSINR